MSHSFLKALVCCLCIVQLAPTSRAIDQCKRFIPPDAAAATTEAVATGGQAATTTTGAAAAGGQATTTGGQAATTTGGQAATTTGGQAATAGGQAATTGGQAATTTTGAVAAGGQAATTGGQAATTTGGQAATAGGQAATAGGQAATGQAATTTIDTATTDAATAGGQAATKTTGAAATTTGAAAEGGQASTKTTDAAATGGQAATTTGAAAAGGQAATKTTGAATPAGGQAASTTTMGEQDPTATAAGDQAAAPTTTMGEQDPTATAAGDQAAAPAGQAAAPAGQAAAGVAGPDYIAGFGGAWELQQENAGVSAMHLIIMPNTNTALMYDTSVLGPSIINLLPGQVCRKVLEPPGTPDDCTAHAIAYDTNTGNVRPLMVATDFWCSSGGLTVEGSLISIGGTADGGRTVRYLDPCPNCEFRDIPNAVAEPRWYSTQVQLPDNRYFVIGGRAAFSYEYVGLEGQLNAKAFFFQFMQDTTDRDENNLYPFVHVSTDGNLFIFANDRSIIFNPNTNQIVRELPVLPGGARSYPASGSSVLLPIRLDANPGPGAAIPAQVMVCGGGPKNAYQEAAKGVFLPALDDCNTIDITDLNGAWAKEVMPSPRTMGDMLLLPNAEVLFINGAKRGCSAWEFAEDPNMVPIMYSLARPAGQRFMELAPANIARMYHSSSALLIDGKILVAGSNTHDRYKFDVKYPTEVRVEKFSPPYLNPALKDSQPQIQPQGTDIKIAYGQPIKVTFAVTAGPMTKETTMVTLYAPVFTTHGCNMNQRLVVLPVQDVVPDPAGAYVATATAPAGPQLAPAGYYMLFVNNGVVPSAGIWVQLK